MNDLSIAPWERHAFPNGGECFYEPNRHRYYRGIKKRREGGYAGVGSLTGVSTLCGPFDFRPDSLMAWVERLTLEGVSRGFAGQQVPDDPHVLRTALDSQSLRWQQIRDEAGRRGTNVHLETLHQLATEGTADLGSLPEDQRGYGQAVFSWWLANEPEVECAERVVFSDTHGFAGRLDLICVPRKGENAGKRVLADLKTSKYVSAKMPVQVAGYDLGYVESGLGGPCDALVIVQAREDGTFREVEVTASHADFLGALFVYRRAADLSKGLRVAA